MSEALITSLRNALLADPGDAVLRLHLAQVLLDAGRASEALTEVSAVLSRSATDAQALSLLSQVARAMSDDAPMPAERDGEPETFAGDEVHGQDGLRQEQAFDWEAAQRELDASLDGLPALERPALRLDDVGGMHAVKQRLEVSFLAPLRNPELRKAYRKSLRGGLLLYGPPGCGKTFLARAVAGEMGAAFHAVSLADVLDMWVGSSERNLQQLFRTARSHAPCVLFLDEVDAIGHKRSALSNTGMRGTVNQLLNELDSVQQDNEGVYVLAATNAPWDVDSALRRPGRLDRTLLVLPPDLEARQAVLALHLEGRPTAELDLARIAQATEDFSGADLAHLVEVAAEHAMLDAAKSGNVRPITSKDFNRAFKEVRSSTGAWLQSARNVALFGNETGEYDELLAYLKRRRLV